MKHVIRRGSWFHFKRRVPDLYRPYYESEFIQVSLKTDSERVAAQRASILNHEIEQLWSELGTEGGQGPESSAFDAAVATARMSGFNYRPAREIADFLNPQN